MALVHEHAARLDSGNEPLFRRGWALHEQILSPRVPICNRDQLVWERQTESFTERGQRMEALPSMRLDAGLSTEIKSA